jgi:hypothetical protein
MKLIRNFGLLLLVTMFCAQQHAAAQTIDKLLGNGRSRWAQFQLVDGRIRTISPYFGRFRVYPPDDKKQRLSIGTNMAGVGVLRFRWSDEKLDVAAEATETGELRITHAPKGDGTSVHLTFTQPKRGPVVLTVGTGDKQQRLEAASIWHLLLEHPQTCQVHLYPLLNVLRSSWHLDQDLKNLKGELFRIAKANSSPDRAQWAALVKQLSSDKFVKRQKAERLLRGFGRAAVPYLQGLDRNKLDAEQQFRIKHIVLASYEGSNDTPGRAATWLVGDPRAWLPLLASETVELRRQAAAQLKELVGGTIAFEPDADAATRQKQIAEIRKTLAQ